MSSASLAEELEFFRGLVEQYSPSGEEDGVREYLQEVLPEMGFVVETDSVGNVIASIGGEESEVLLTSHMDTVRGEIPVEVEDGLLYGRGSVDAKGALASMFLAASRCSNVDSRVTVAAVVEEEKSGRGAHHLTESRDAPKYLVNGEPSGWSTVTLGYRGILRLRYRVTGEVIHTARPGVNAIEDVLEFWKIVQELGEDDGFRSVSTSPTKIDSNSDGFELHSELRGNIRIPPGRSVNEIKEIIEERASDLNGHIYWGESTEPVLVDRSNPVVRAFIRSVRDEGGEPGLSVKTGTSDMNVYAESWDCPMVTYGPGDSNLDHTPDEHIELDEFHRSVDVLERVVRDLASGSA